MVNSDVFAAFGAAGDYLRQHGWQRGELGQDGGPRCVGGALMSAMGMTHAHQLEGWLQEVQLARVVGQREPAGSVFRGVIQNFNDFQARGAEDVIDFCEGIALQGSLRAVAVADSATAESQKELVPVG